MVSEAKRLQSRIVKIFRLSSDAKPLRCVNKNRMDFNRKVMVFSVSVLGVSLAMFLFAYMVYGDNTEEDLRTLRQTNVSFINSNFRIYFYITSPPVNISRSSSDTARSTPIEFTRSHSTCKTFKAPTQEVFR